VSKRAFRWWADSRLPTSIPVSEKTHTIIVNDHGALILLVAAVEIQQIIRLENLNSGRNCSAESPAWVRASWVRRRLRLNLLCRRRASGTNDFNLGTLRFSGEGQAQNGNSGLVIPPPQDQYRPKDKLNNQHQQRIAHCADVAMHVRVVRAIRLVWESPEVTALQRGQFGCRCSPQSCDTQLRSQNLVVQLSPASTLDMMRVNHCLPNEKLRVGQSCFPQCAN